MAMDILRSALPKQTSAAKYVRRPRLALMAVMLTVAASAAGAEQLVAVATPEGCGHFRPTASALATPAASDLQLISATWVEADSMPSYVGSEAVPAHCQLVFSMAQRTSAVDGRDYAIGFELRLPAEWNGRFLYQANGGNDGVIVPALGSGNMPDGNALSRGFAVASSDAGHSDDRSSLISGNLYGFDPQARLDYGYQATIKVTEVAKALVDQFYEQPIRHSYIMGCSNGGRHAMVATARYPDAFDGFIAGNPGFNLPRAAVAQAWDFQQLHALSPENVAAALTREDMTLVADAVRARCDGLDGLEDGLVENLPGCQQAFDLQALQCSASQSACLPAGKIEALRKIFDGPTDSQGNCLYASLPFDAGIGSHEVPFASWRSWKIEGPIAGLPLTVTLGAGSLAHVFTTPPTRLEPTPQSLMAYLLNFDFDAAESLLTATTGPYTESAMEFMTPPGAEQLEGLAAARGKLIVYHGNSDPVFSVNDTIAWYETLDRNHRGRAATFARLFTIPGMGHCGTGPATDQFDMLTAMVDWVENGQAPDAVKASVSPANPALPAGWSRQRTRLLCPWPLQARYQGDGDTESAASQRCVMPEQRK